MGRPASPWWREDRRCWYVTINGRQVKLHTNKAEAHRLWGELLNAATEPDGPTVAEVVAAAEPATEFAASVLRRLVETEGSRRAADLTPDGVAAWLSSVPTWSRGTRWLAAGVLRRTLGVAVRMPYPKARSLDCMPSREDHEALKGVAPPLVADALELLWLTGARPSEVCNLTAADIQDGLAVLARHKTARTGRPRVIVLPPRAVEIVRRLASDRPAGRLLGGLTARKLSQWLRNVRRRKPGLIPQAVCLYGYRHAFATDALAAGVPDSIVAELLGHGSPALLQQHYAHVAARRDALRDAAAKVAASR